MASTRIAQVISHLDAAPCAAASAKRIVNVCVTGAAGNIAYAILFHIGAGRMLGPDQPIQLRLLDIPVMMDKIKGVEMELKDCAYPVITSIISTTDYETAFRNVDVAILIGAKPRGPGMVRADLLLANAKIFAGQGRALNDFASRQVKVVVVGNPCNTNAVIVAVNAPDLPAVNITALTRLDQNRAVAQVADKVGVDVDSISNIIIWGNHSKTQYADVNHAVLRTSCGKTVPLRSAINDDAWIRGNFLTTVQQRGAAIIAARKLSSAASAANAAVDHIRSWALGTKPGTMVSMAVPSDGSYGIPKGIIYSFPVTCQNFRYQIVQGLQIDSFSREKMSATAKELIDEKNQALAL